MNPRIGDVLETAINAYEDAVRRFCDLQRALAAAAPLGPARSVLMTTADVTRDVAALQLSGVRWLLDS